MKKGNTELDRFFSVATDILCIMDEEGVFRRINPAVTSILGWSVEEVLNRPLFDFLDPDDKISTIKRISRDPSDSIASADNRYRHKDGSWRIIAWRSVKTDDGLLYATGRDVTEQREFESGLQAARNEAEQANAAKNEFLSRMSHELRTPMNAVLGYAQLLDLKYEDQDIKSATHAIMKGGKHLLELINEVLDLSRIESGNLGISIEPVALDELIAHSISLLKQSSEISGVIMNDHRECQDIYVQADRQRLLQVLLNVLGNAIKYNKLGGSVNVRCKVIDDETYRVEISDTGAGIEPAAQALIFQPFQRFGDLGIDGTGLGLALSERFMKLMGGAIGLVESSSMGSTFFIDLKRDRSPKNHLLKSRESNFDEVQIQSGGRVLYIEDNLSNVNLVEAILADREGIELTCAAQGRIGLQLASSYKPDLILLDVHLPDLMGDKVLEHLKENAETQNIPVVMLSADVTPRQVRASLDLGAEEYLTKPLDVSKLFEILNKFLPTKK